MLIQWSDRFATGHALVDQQHQALFGAIQDFDLAVTGAGEPEAIQRTLAFLASYTRDHFATEEGLMMRCAFPGLALHAQEHANLNLRVQFITRLWETDPARVSLGGLSRFLSEWWSNHIQVWDAEIFTYLREKPLPVPGILPSGPTLLGI